MRTSRLLILLALALTIIGLAFGQQLYTLTNALLL